MANNSTMTSSLPVMTCECFYVEYSDNGSVGARREVFDTCDGRPPVDCVTPTDVNGDPMHVIVYGYVSTAVILLTVVTNGFVCAVLRQRHMHSATNTLLVAMAVANTMTGVCPLPFYLYFYADVGGGSPYAEHLHPRWCLPYIIMADHLPTAFHTASVWLTLTLASQRYLYVCHATRAKRHCTVRNALRATAVVYALAGLSQICRFFDSVIVPVQARSLVDPSVTVDACVQQLVPAIRQRVNWYFGIYYWFRVVFVHVLPCVLLVTLTALLVNAMRRAAVRRRQLLLLGSSSSGRSHNFNLQSGSAQGQGQGQCASGRGRGGGSGGRLSDSQATTLMLIAVVASFLVVELPLASIFVMFIVKETWEVNVVEPQIQGTVNLVVNLCILLSYPLNFVIYCAMSRQFRETFRALLMFFCCRGGGQSPSGAAGGTERARKGGGAELTLDGDRERDSNGYAQLRQQTVRTTYNEG